MKNFLSRLLLLSVIAISLFNCKGEKGNPGPQGVQGVQGDAGPSATSYNFSITFSSSNFSKVLYTGLPVGSENDAILVYWKNTTVSGYNDWVLLPFTYGTYYMMYADVVPALGLVYLTFQTPSTTPSYPGTGSSTYAFKAVVIKGMTGAKMSSDINYNNYDEVKAYYNLKD